MAIKDFVTSENIDKGKETNDMQKHSLPIKPEVSTEANDTTKTNIKNAHASGDGSFGRDEGRVADKEEKEKESDSVY